MFKNRYPIKNDLLIERNFGVMTGKPMKDISNLCAPHIIKTDTITYFTEADGVETFPEVLMRANTILQYIHENHTNQNILLVTHGDIGKMLYACYYKFDWQHVLNMFSFWEF